MENITPNQRKRQENILAQINEELKRQEKLKKDIQQETDKLIAVRIATNENINKDKIFKVLVKVFDSLYDIHYLYNQEIPKLQFEQLHQYKDSKFYLIEIYTSRTFREKIIHQNWLLNIVIQNRRMHLTRNISLDDKSFSNNDRILIILPFDNSTEDSTVTASLYKKFNTIWSTFCISTLRLDVSYHFTTQPIHDNQVTKLTLGYNPSLSTDDLKSKQIQFSLMCKCDSKHFFESIIKNCYHRLNLDTFSNFEAPQRKFTTNFHVNGPNEIEMKLENSQETLTVISSIEYLGRIRRYFLADIKSGKLCMMHKNWLSSILNLQHYLALEMQETRPNPTNFKHIYEELNKLIFEQLTI